MRSAGSTILSSLSQLLSDRRDRRRYRRAVAMLGAVVALATALAFMLPALGLTSDNATESAGFHLQAATIPGANADADGGEASAGVAGDAGSGELTAGQVAGEGAEGGSEGSETAATANAEAVGAAGIAGALQRSVLTSDGKNYLVKVTYGPDAGVPQQAQLSVREMQGAERDEYAARAEAALGYAEGSAPLVRLFDIKILDANGEKVQIAAPVNVTIALDDDVPAAAEEAAAEVAAAEAAAQALAEAEAAVDAEPTGQAAGGMTQSADASGSESAAAGIASATSAASTTTSTPLQVVHFPDDADEPSVVDAVNVSAETVTFEADGFSAYAIVEGPDPGEAMWRRITTIDELAIVGDGLYIGHPNGYYFMDTTVVEGGRTGIKKTTPASKSNPPSDAVKYYFEKVENTENKFYAYRPRGKVFTNETVNI